MVILNRMAKRRTSGQDGSDGTSNNPSESPSIGFPWQLTARHAQLMGGASGSGSAGQSGPAATAPRHPEILRRSRSRSDAPTQSSPTDGDGGSSGVPMVPSGLFLPPTIPAIPRVDEEGRPIREQLPHVAPHEAYIYREFPTPLHPVRVSEQADGDESVGSASSSGNLLLLFCRFTFFFCKNVLLILNLIHNVTAAGTRRRNRRGTVSNKGLDRAVESAGRIAIPFSNGKPVDAALGNRYTRAAGGTIRSRLPMLWGVWSQVPDGVKEMLHQSMSVSLLDQLLFF